MGDINQKMYVERNIEKIDGPILEVGSKDYGSTIPFRDHFPSNEYIGLDMEEGKGVDIVLNLEHEIGSLKPESFGLIICCSVLEHVRKPWIFADNLSTLVKEGGKVYMSVPWVWRYHPYPDDYYRFSWKGIIELFPDFEWSQIEYSTNIPGEFFPITETKKDIDNQIALYKNISSTPPLQRKYLPYLMINMIGTKLKK